MDLVRSLEIVWIWQPCQLHYLLGQDMTVMWFWEQLTKVQLSISIQRKTLNFEHFESLMSLFLRGAAKQGSLLLLHLQHVWSIEGVPVALLVSSADK